MTKKKDNIILPEITVFFGDTELQIFRYLLARAGNWVAQKNICIELNLPLPTIPRCKSQIRRKLNKVKKDNFCEKTEGHNAYIKITCLSKDVEIKE